MLPTLKPGKLVLARKRSAYQAGDVVLVKTKSRELVKRIYSVDNGVVTLRGDNTSDSRDYEMEIDDVFAAVIFPST